MFSAYSWFVKPELYASVRTNSLKWAGADTLLVSLQLDPAETMSVPQKRNLEPAELVWLKKKIDKAWVGQDFGGFVSEVNLADLKGWFHFKLNPEKTEARLEGLLLDVAQAEFPPLQNPALHLVLIELLKEFPELQAVFLPFGEVSELDQEALRMFWLAPGQETGGWLTRQTFQRKTDFLAYMLDLRTPTWFEIRVRVEAGISRLVRLLFMRFGYRDKTRFEIPLKSGVQGEELEDETGPFTIVTFLPDNENNHRNLTDLQEALRNLSIISPVPELEIKEVSRAGAISIKSSNEYSNGIYRVGRNFILQILSEDGKNSEVELWGNDFLIKLKPYPKVFGPQRGFIHPTGQLALELLEDWLDPAQHFKILDLGTGSGSLSIAAARRGINYILAIDPNREAVKVARINAALNGLEDKIVVEDGSLGLKDSNDRPNGYNFDEELQQRPPSLDKDLPFDAILANILAPNLITLAGAMSESLRSGGLLISSGIATATMNEVDAAYQAAGLKLVEKRELFNWNAFVHRKE